MADTGNRQVQTMMDALRYCHESIGLSENSHVVPVSLRPGKYSFNLDVLHALLRTASDEARAVQLNRQRLDADAGSRIVRKAIDQTAGLVKVGVKLVRK